MVSLPNIPSVSTATDVLVLDAGNVKRSSASGLISGFAWMLTGNSITSAWNGTSGNFLGTTNAQPLVIATTNTASPQPIQFWTDNVERVRITQDGHVLPGADDAYDLGSATRRWSSGYFGTQVKVGTSVSLVAATNELAYTGGDGRISVAGASALRVSTNGFAGVGDLCGHGRGVERGQCELLLGQCHQTVGDWDELADGDAACGGEHDVREQCGGGPCDVERAGGVARGAVGGQHVRFGRRRDAAAVAQWVLWDAGEGRGERELGGRDASGCV
jgi:hypothetical protein